MKAEKELEVFQRQIARIIFPEIVNQLHKSGEISNEELSNKKLVFKKIREFLDKNKGLPNLEIIVDHRETILESAENENKKGHFELSVTLYATFVEHTLNRIIHLACVSKKIDTKTQTEVIKNINIIGKCTWLLKLLELPPLNEKHVRTILAISDQRNSYIHYKWKPEKDTDKVPDLEKKNHQETEDLKKIKALLRYLKSYESKIEYNGKKRQIHNISK